MAVLNEYCNYGPNYWMLIVGFIGLLACTVLCIRALIRCILSNNWKGRIREMLLGCACIICALIFGFIAANYDKPEYRIPNGKKRIEATFALGHPSAFILDKYDVVGMKDKYVYILEEK